MAYQDHRHPAPLGKGDQLMRSGPHLADRSGRAFHGVEPHRLDRIDHRQCRAFGIQRRQDVAQIGFRAQDHRRIRQAQPLGAHPDLGCRLFAGDIQALVPGAGKAGGGLQKKGGFADAGIAPHQNGRGGHKAAAQDPVQLVHPRRGAGRWRVFGGQIAQRNRAALGAQRLWRGRERRLFDDRVPGAAGIAAARPFRMGGATGRAGEGGG